MSVIRAVRGDAFVQYTGNNAEEVLSHLNSYMVDPPLYTYVSEANDVLTVNTSVVAASVYAWTEGDLLIPENYYVGSPGVGIISPADFAESYIVKS